MEEMLNASPTLPAAVNAPAAAPLPPAPGAYLRLRRRQQRFVDLYVECGIGAEAVRRLDKRAKRPDQVAWKYLHDAEIRAAVEERKAEAIADFKDRLPRLLEGVFNRANADRSAFVDVSKNPTDPGTWSQELRDCIESVEFEKGVLTKIRTSPRNEASKLLMQYLQVLIEQLELRNKNGAALAGSAVVYVIAKGEAEVIRGELKETV